MSIEKVPGLRARPRRHGHGFAHAAGNTLVTIEQFDKEEPSKPRNCRQSVALAAIVLRLVAFHVLLVVALVLNGCDSVDLAVACEDAQLCEADPLPDETIDLLFDQTPGSPSVESHHAAARAALEYLAVRPDSMLRVWVLDGVPPTQPALQLTVPQGRHRSARSQEREQSEWVAERLQSITMVTTNSASRARRSPLAESVTRIAGFPATGRRTFLIVSDLRERSSVASLECGRLPSPARFVERVAAHELLSPGSLQGVDVLFAFAQARPLESARCASSLSREVAIAELWRSALARAGAARVEVSQAAPVLVCAPSPETHTNTEPTNDHR